MLLNRSIIKVSLLFMMLIAIVSGCKKLVEVDAPVSSVNGSNVYNDDGTAISAVTSIYASMSNASFSGGGMTSLSLFPALSADELTLISSTINTGYLSYYRNSLTSSSTSGTDFWNYAYIFIYNCNAAIEGISQSSRLSPHVKQQLLGEAKFLRAFFYFYLVNLYGDVPTVTNSQYTENILVERASTTTVYAQIKADLTDAKSLLQSGYMNKDLKLYIQGIEERVRPNKESASALLARVYLYTSEFALAESEAGSVISNTNYYQLLSLKDVFIKNSKESIFQLQPVSFGINTQDARFFILPSTGPSNSFPVYLSNDLLNSFETGDLRRYNRNWIDSVKVGTQTFYFPYKYKLNDFPTAAVKEYNTVLRLSEQYLIRAEARAQQNKLSEGLQDVNKIRNRAGLNDTTASNKDALLRIILHERQVELFTEWGHRWLDLKRSGTIDLVMATAASNKGGSWSTTDQLYPVPISEMRTNPKLIQNPGYN